MAWTSQVLKASRRYGRLAFLSRFPVNDVSRYLFHKQWRSNEQFYRLIARARYEVLYCFPYMKSLSSCCKCLIDYNWYLICVFLESCDNDPTIFLRLLSSCGKTPVKQHSLPVNCAKFGVVVNNLGNSVLFLCHSRTFTNPFEVIITNLKCDIDFMKWHSFKERGTIVSFV